MFILNIFGIGSDLDIFFASNTLNYIILAISTGAINSAITPILIKVYKSNDKYKLSELVSSIFNSIFILFLLFAVIQYIFAKDILHIILPGFDDIKLVPVIVFFRIQAFLSIFTIATALLLALHYSNKNFYRTVIYPIIGQLAQMLFVLFFYRKYGIYSLVYGLVLNQMLVFILFAFPFVSIYKFRIIFSSDLKNATLKIFPLIVSSGFSKSNVLVDRFFASTLSVGSITLLQYGQRIINIVSGFINNGISIVSLRKFSLEQDNEVGFQRLFYIVYKTMIFLIIPVSFLLIFFLKDGLNLIILSKKLAHEDVNNIYLVTVAFIGILIGGSLNSTITNAFYAKGLTKIVANLSVVFQSLGIVLKVVLFYCMGFWGLPIAFSINGILGVFALFILYYKKIYKYNVLELLKYFSKVIIITILAISPSLLLAKMLTELWFVKIFVELSIFIILFIVFSLIIENDISAMIYKRIKEKLMCGKNL